MGSSMVDGAASPIRDASLGPFHVLDDGLMLELLSYIISPVDLAKLMVVSKAFYCLASYEELWKCLLLSEFEARFTWAGKTWKEAYEATKYPRWRASASQRQKKKQRVEGSGGCEDRLRVSGFYSDLLYQPWRCATIDLDSHGWLEVDNIERVSALSCSTDEFKKRFEVPNRPVVITDLVNKWPALNKWTPDYLEKAFQGKDIIAGNYLMSYETYLTYQSNQVDEMPLYLFDKTFLDTAPNLAHDFEVPRYFTDDLFSVLGSKRPDFRWLIIGPTLSGSSWHQDPNSTSAWNAVISGKKKWILYPPEFEPPGVHSSPDGSEVATSVSLVEWLLNFYDDTKYSNPRPIECICSAGDLLFVPKGWWHMAINLEPTVAVTQNFVSRISLPHVLNFLKSGSQNLVSGCAHEEREGLYGRFVSALEIHRPSILKDINEIKAMKDKKHQEDHKLATLLKPGSEIAIEEAKPRGETLAAASSSAFSFGFSFMQ